MSTWKLGKHFLTHLLKEIIWTFLGKLLLVKSALTVVHTSDQQNVHTVLQKNLFRYKLWDTVWNYIVCDSSINDFFWDIKKKRDIFKLITKRSKLSLQSYVFVLREMYIVELQLFPGRER